MRGTEVNPGNASVFPLLFVVVPALSSSCCPLFFQFPFWTRLSLFEGTFTGRVMTMFGYDTSLGLSWNKKTTCLDGMSQGQGAHCVHKYLRSHPGCRDKGVFTLGLGSMLCGQGSGQRWAQRSSHGVFNPWLV